MKVTKEQVRKLAQKLGITTAAAMLLIQQAQAAAITLPPELTDALASVGIVGAGVFAIAVGVKLYKWIKAAL